MKKVYLAKSNLVDYNMLIMIKTLLRDKYECEVYEFDQNRDMLLSCDVLIVISADKEPINMPDDDQYLRLGKGLMSQLESFHNKKIASSFIVNLDLTNKKYEETNPEIWGYEDFVFEEFDTKDWRLAYGRAVFNESDITSLSVVVPLKPAKTTEGEKKHH